MAGGASQVGLRVVSRGGGRRHAGGPHVLDHGGLIIRGRPAGGGQEADARGSGGWGSVSSGTEEGAKPLEAGRSSEVDPSTEPPGGTRL